MNRKLALAGLVLVLVAMPAARPAHAAVWEHTLALYGLATAMDGTVSLGEVDAPVTIDADQMFDSLEMAAMARYRGQTERWAFVIDGSFAGLGGTREGLVTKQDLDVDIVIAQADAAWRFSPHTELLFGARYVLFESQLDTTTAAGGTRRRKNDATLVDPVVGLRSLFDLGEKMRLQTQVDVGGGGGNDLTWQAMLNLGYQPSDGVSFWLGYRAISLDFDESGGRNRFGGEVTLHGPALGVAFHF